MESLENTVKIATINQWIRDGDRWWLLGPQRTPEWFEARRYRITASAAYTATGKSKFSTADQLAGELLGTIAPKELNDAMMCGIMYEDEARDHYIRTSGIDASTVVEVAFIVWERYPHLGVSPDGIVGNDGMLEIKCPKTMYAPLAAVMAAVASGNPDPRRNTDYVFAGRPTHIWASHYTQMQMQMAIAGRQWCDYVVYAFEDGLLYTERIPFNIKYWEWTLGHLTRFIATHLRDRRPLCPWK